MAHDGLAKAWAELQRRIDISNIVHEILGHFDLSSIGTSPSAAQSFSFIVWMKVVYDLQRTYLQSSELSVESISYLLPPRILFTTIYYVLEKVTQLFLQPWGEEDGNSKIAQREFAAQALLSGLRALQLQLRRNLEVSFTTEEIEKAHSLLQKWLQEIDGPGNTEPERFTLLKCETALSQICRGPEVDSVWHLPANGTCKLDDYNHNLYSAWPSDATSAFNAQLELLQAGSEDSFWALFDILWAAEASFIQWSVDGLLDDTLLEYDSPVRSLVGRIAEIGPGFPEVACSTVLKQHWSDRLSYGPGTSVAFASRVETSLTAFQTFLQNRRTTLVDYNLEIRKLSTELQEKIESWIRQESGYTADKNLRGEGQQPLETAYVLRCPHLHVISECEMMSLVKENKHHIFKSPKLLNLERLEVQCPQCTSIQVVMHARMIEPLQYMSDRLSNVLEDSITLRQPKVPSLQDSPQLPQSPPFPRPLRERQNSAIVHPLIAAQSSWNRGTFTDPIIEPSLPRTPSPDPPPQKSPRKGSTESNSTISTYTVGVQERKSFFGKIRSSTFGRRPEENPQKIDEVTTPKVAVEPVFKSYCFSTDGKTLILWDQKTSHVYASAIPTKDGQESVSMWSWSRLIVPGVMLVTGGGSNVAVVLKEDKSTFKLKVFTTLANPNALPIINRKLHGKDQFQSLTTSIMGNLVAVGTERHVYVYDVTNPTCPCRKIAVKRPVKVDFNSQRVTFTRNGGQVVVATRWSNGQTEIILYDLGMSLEVWSKTTGAGGIADQDHGVSALFYDTGKEKVVMTVYNSADYNVVHSQDGSSIPWKKGNGKVQAAAACASGSRYLLLSATGSLHALDLGQQAPLSPLLGWNLRYKPKSAAQFIALATPENGCIYAFWVDNDRMKLEVIRGDNEPKPKEFRGPTL